ncbi:MAG TPA: hypothetical protein VMW80_14125 [Candidatus Dormibacteraeota bacterium]|nr:hypothetical protein [Candidatus Dormibacteraeota bacterium]
MTCPVAARVSSQPRWLFLRLAVLVTLVLWLPLLWILAHREPIRGVGVLSLRHLAIVFIAFDTLVRLAPVGLLTSSSAFPAGRYRLEG